MPKKSRRDRKRTQQRSVAQTNETSTAQTELPSLQFTDFSQPQDIAPVVDAATGLTVSNESAENVLAREDEPEVAQALRRVQRKTGAKSPLRPARPVSQPPLPPESAAIPLALVPYVMSDLRRVAFSAVVIAIFIVVSGAVVTHLVH